MRRSPRFIVGWCLALLLILLPALVSCQDGSFLAVKVVRVVDGDTIQVCCIGWKREKVRYIGINTPETKHPTKEVEHYGEKASEANRMLVDGKTVRMEFDVQQVDRYKRLLAYVYLKDGTFVKEAFIRPTTMRGTVLDLNFSKDPEQLWVFVADGRVVHSILASEVADSAVARVDADSQLERPLQA